MCFTPAVSLSTALFEFIVAWIILSKFKKTVMNKYFAILCIVLGLYQFSEFLLCVTDFPLFFAKLGFISYTFLPAIGLVFAFDVFGVHHDKRIVFVMPILYSVVALVISDFILFSSCNSFFVTVRTMFSTSHNIFVLIYNLYYFGFIYYTCYIFYKHVRHEKIVLKKQLYLWTIAAIVFSLLPAVMLLFILPTFSVMFPSIYCHFAILIAIVALIVAYKSEKSSL